jgi:quercetin dioxygenase-like cupin family protein
MLSTGRKLDIGDHTVEVVANPAETGDRYRIRIVAEPGGPGIKGNFPHIHPKLIETFQCVSGDMKVRVGKEVSVLNPGKTAVVAAGLVHGFLNTGSEPLIVDSEVIFPDGYARRDDLLQIAAFYDRLRGEGPVSKKTGEPPMLQMAVLVDSYRHVMVQHGMMGVLMTPLAALGRIRGYGSSFPESEDEDLGARDDPATEQIERSEP